MGEQHKVTGQTFANLEKPQLYPPTERGVSQFSKKHSEHVMFSLHSHCLCPVLFPTRISPGLTSHLLGGTLSCLSSKASHSFYLALLPPSDSSDGQLSKLLLHFLSASQLWALQHMASPTSPLYLALRPGIWFRDVAKVPPVLRMGTRYLQKAQGLVILKSIFP